MAMLKLVATNGQEFHLGAAGGTVGRSQDNQVVLDHAQVSRHHARIEWAGTAYVIRDLDSTNGTLVNGQPVRVSGPLKAGDEIRLGPEVRLMVQQVQAVSTPVLLQHTAAPAWPILGAISGVAIVFVVVLLLAVGSRRGPPVRFSAGIMPSGPAVTGIGGGRSTLAQVPATPAVTPIPPPTESSLTEANLPTATPSLIAASTRPPTVTPTFLASSTSTPQPLSTATIPRPTYSAPTLRGPDDGTTFSGARAQVTLNWDAVGTLAQDEYYDVSVRYKEGGDLQYSGTWTQDTHYSVPAFLFGKADGAEFMWDVTVRRQTGTRPDGGKTGPTISAASATRKFYWRPGGGAPGTVSTPTFEREGGKEEPYP
jgi:hypothetical protein